MKADVERYVKECQICQQVKMKSFNQVVLLQPLSILEHIWEDISMKFIEGLLEVQGYSLGFGGY
jgi:hypothetical protein